MTITAVAARSGNIIAMRKASNDFIRLVPQSTTQSTETDDE